VPTSPVTRPIHPARRTERSRPVRRQAPSVDFHPTMAAGGIFGWEDDAPASPVVWNGWGSWRTFVGEQPTSSREVETRWRSMDRPCSASPATRRQAGKVVARPVHHAGGRRPGRVDRDRGRGRQSPPTPPKRPSDKALPVLGAGTCHMQRRRLEIFLATIAGSGARRAKAPRRRSSGWPPSPTFVDRPGSPGHRASQRDGSFSRCSRCATKVYTDRDDDLGAR
jgi:hypothetical protein